MKHGAKLTFCLALLLVAGGGFMNMPRVAKVAAEEATSNAVAVEGSSAESETTTDDASQATDTKVEGADASTDTLTAEKQKTFEQKKEDVLKQFPQVSDIGVVGDLMLLVYSKVDRTDIVGNSLVQKQTKGIFLFMRMDVLNTGKKAQTIDSSMFTLVSSNGSVYESDPTAAIYANVDNAFIFQKVNPGVETSGYLVFDVPRDLKREDVTLRVTQGKDHLDLSLQKRS